MKIGIISINMYSKGLNFACPLHTYAFQQFLIKNGIDSTVINYQPIYYDNYNLRHPLEYFEGKYQKYLSLPENTEEELELKEYKLKLAQQRIDQWSVLYADREVRYDKFQKFIDENYIKTEKVYNSDLLEVYDPDCDIYMCVTDVIWKNAPDYGMDRGYFLGSHCMENKWKVSYAASRGVHWATEQDEHDKFFRYVNDIDYVAVREKSLKEYIEEHSDKHAELVLDPVLLHEKSFYEKLAVKPQEENYILLYYVMEKATDTVRHAIRYARMHNLQIVELSDSPVNRSESQELGGVKVISRYDVGIEEWLGYIQHAEYIFTNSFHACCFSILFEKNFFVGRRNGDKVSNVLNTFGLSERILTKNSVITDEIDADRERLARLKRKQFVVKALNKLTGKKIKKLVDERKRVVAQVKKLKSSIYVVPSIDYTEIRQILEEKRKQSAEYILNVIHEIEAKGAKEQKDCYDACRRNLKYEFKYHSGKAKSNLSWCSEDAEDGQEFKEITLRSGAFEYMKKTKTPNDETEHFAKCRFSWENHELRGWNLRLRIDTMWFWYLQDGTLIPKNEYHAKTAPVKLKVFKPEDTIPHLPVNRVAVAVAEAVWKEVKKK
ncbi:MAG: polysaccharide pyruvyl transferase family protein [Lachnospiraceae bacterium]|nr:polysaccharide pyruvyl transferase family protein [Lachnospiraceae bacterium]